MTKLKYILSKGRLLTRLDSPLLEGWDVARDWRHLEPGTVIVVDDTMDPGVKWKGTKIPAELFRKVLGTVRKFNRLEMGLVLEYRVDDGAWNIELTDQSEVNGVHFHCEDTHQHDGFLSMGDLHTHPNMPAFFSGEDKWNGRKNGYGVHIILGHHNGVVDSTAASVNTLTSVYEMSIWDFVEELDLAGVYEPDEAWLKKLEEDAAREEARRARKIQVRDSFTFDRQPATTFAPWAVDPCEEEAEEDEEECGEDDEDEDSVFEALEDARDNALDRIDAINLAVNLNMARMASDDRRTLGKLIRQFGDRLRKCVLTKSYAVAIHRFLPELVAAMKKGGASEETARVLLGLVLEGCSCRIKVADANDLLKRHCKEDR